MPGQRGRPAGFVMSPEHRAKLQKSNILNALLEHVEGRREMSSTQVTAGVALLKKFLPDLQAVQHSGDSSNPLEHNHHIPATDAERAAAIVAMLGKAKD